MKKKLKTKLPKSLMSWAYESIFSPLSPFLITPQLHKLAVDKTTKHKILILYIYWKSIIVEKEATDLFIPEIDFPF